MTHAAAILVMASCLWLLPLATGRWQVVAGCVLWPLAAVATILGVTDVLQAVGS